jgi:hypothetical protein
MKETDEIGLRCHIASVAALRRNPHQIVEALATFVYDKPLTGWH